MDRSGVPPGHPRLFCLLESHMDAITLERFLSDALTVLNACKSAGLPLTEYDIAGGLRCSKFAVRIFVTDRNPNIYICGPVPNLLNAIQISKTLDDLIAASEVDPQIEADPVAARKRRPETQTPGDAPQPTA